MRADLLLFLVFVGTAAAAVAVGAVPRNLDFQSLSGFGFTVSGEDSMLALSTGYGLALVDYDGDGHDDLAVTAKFGDARRVYLVYGPLSRDVHLPPLGPNEGFVITDTPAGNLRTLLAEGDFNGDGIEDLVVGSSMSTGLAGIMWGQRDRTVSEVNFTTLALTGMGTLFRSDSDEYMGRTIQPTPDVNGDRIDDILISASSARRSETSPRIGAAYLVLGHRGDWPGTIDLGNGALPGGIVKIWGDPASTFAGYDVAGCKDVNGDGLGDFVMSGDMNMDSYVVFGRTDGKWPKDVMELDGTNGFTVNGKTIPNCGQSVDCGDINGDGLSDVVLGSSAGVTTVLFGRSEPWESHVAVTRSNLDGTDGFTVYGEAVAHSDDCIRVVGDINGDSVADLAVGMPNYGSGTENVGAAFVVYGRRSPWTPLVSLAELDPETTGFSFKGTAANEKAGYSFANNPGDIDGDGIDDLLVGAPSFVRLSVKWGRAAAVFGTFWPADCKTRDNATLNCTSCLAGTVFSNGMCEKCPANTFNTDGSSPCQSCVSGDCVRCSGDGVCKRCRPGFVPSGYGLSCNPQDSSSSSNRGSKPSHWKLATILVVSAATVAMTVIPVIAAVILHGSKRRAAGKVPTERHPLLEAADFGVAAVAMAASGGSPGKENNDRDSTKVSTEGIAAASDPLAVCVDFGKLAEMNPSAVTVAELLKVHAHEPGVAAFSLRNRCNMPVQYRIDSTCCGPAFEVTVAEVRMSDGSVPEPTAEVARAALGMLLSLRPTGVVSGELRADSGSATFVVFVRASMWTSRRPRIGVAVGIAPPPAISLSSRRIPAGTPRSEFAVTAFGVSCIVDAHALLDPSEVEVLREIGRGSFGTVYEAMWRGQSVAVKEQAFVEGGSNGEEVRRELNYLASLRSAFVVQFYGFAVVRNVIQIVTEYCSLGSMDALLRRSSASGPAAFDAAVPLALRARFALDISRGMQFLAASNVVHRDLKPGNVLVIHMRPEEPVACCKLTDFGCARSSAADSAVAGHSGFAMTKGVGTPSFMAPELLRGGRGIVYTQSSDVFAFAVTLYQIFSGKEPYEELESVLEMANFVSGGGRPSIADVEGAIRRTTEGNLLLSDVAARVAEIIGKCWDQCPDVRPPFDAVTAMLAPLSILINGCSIQK